MILTYPGMFPSKSIDFSGFHLASSLTISLWPPIPVILCGFVYTYQDNWNSTLQSRILLLCTTFVLTLVRFHRFYLSLTPLWSPTCPYVCCVWTVILWGLKQSYFRNRSLNSTVSTTICHLLNQTETVLSYKKRHYNWYEVPRKVMHLTQSAIKTIWLVFLVSQ